jgi:hypothetical protein
MDILHKLLLAGEITATAIASLITISVVMASVRAAIAGAAPKWDVSQVAVAEGKASQEGWPHRMLVAFDIAFNVIVLRGQQDETISSHSGRAALEGKTWGKWMSWWLSGFQPNHCYKAMAGDLERAKSRVEVLSKVLGV